MTRPVIVAALLVALVGCGTSDPNVEVRLGATPPCTRAHDLFVDTNDGILNDAEFRGEFADVARRARGTDVEDEARALMVALTDGDDPAAPVAAFIEACTDALKRTP